jgi:hypothetical protein
MMFVCMVFDVMHLNQLLLSDHATEGVPRFKRGTVWPVGLTDGFPIRRD